jgi:hypothetical protein
MQAGGFLEGHGMSHDVYIQAHLNGGSQYVQTSDILRCFSVFIADMDDRWIEVQFDEDASSTVFLDTKAPTECAILVNRPCGDRQLTRCLYCVMQLGNFVLFEPGVDRFIVLREETLAHLPEGMAEALGEAWIAPDVESFIDAYETPYVQGIAEC